jgi:hypothetical protein
MKRAIHGRSPIAVILKWLHEALGLRNIRLEESWGPVRLADEECPDWMRRAGSCVVLIVVEQSVALGATLMPATSPE